MTAVDNRQESLVINQAIAFQGVFPGGGGLTIGSIHNYGFNFDTGGSFDPNGGLHAISQHSAYFSLVGTTFGGDGRTTFGVPDLEDSLSVGRGHGSGLPNYVVGQEFGSNDITLTLSNMPGSLGGGGQPYTNAESSVTVINAIATTGIYPGSGHPHGFIGQVAQFAVANSNGLPNGWLAAEGQLLPISNYTALFSLIGTTYGGDGRTTFGLPDLRGRVIQGTGNRTEDPSLGQKFGNLNETLDINELPGSIGGGGQTVDNQQPSLALNFAVAIQGIFPPRDSGSPSFDQAYLGEIIISATNTLPSGYLRAEGQLLPINQYQALFSLFGTIYGGDGRTTFALPDLRGRSILDESTANPIGSVVGNDDLTITDANIASIDFPAIARDDAFNTDEDTAVTGENLLNDNGSGADSDADGDPINVTAVDGNAANVGNSFFTSNGGEVTVNADGTFTYNPNGAFNHLPVGTSGATNLSATDTFTYTVTGGDTATATVTITGVDSHDILIGSVGDDTMNGGVDNDRLEGLGGADALDGGTGTNYATYGMATGAVTVDLANLTNNAGDASGDTYTNIQRFELSPHNDTFVGDGGNNWARGHDGDDILSGGLGRDTLLGGNGVDTVNGGAGNDTLFGDAGDDVLNGDGDNDVLIGGAGADTLNGGSGSRDVASYINASGPVEIYLNNTSANTGDAAGDTYNGIERFYLSDFGDTFTAVFGLGFVLGMGGSDVLNGSSGPDRLQGGDGNDTLKGNSGDDLLFGGAGGDSIQGGGGFDSVYYTDATSGVGVNMFSPSSGVGDAQGDSFSDVERFFLSNFNDTFLSSAGNDQAFGLDGDDELNLGGGADRGQGGAGNDTINGEAGDDLLIGEAGNDTMNGGDGVDKLLGGDGDDILNGGAGADRIFGQAGNDTLSGGGNDGVRDFFYIAPGMGADTITDFVINIDDVVVQSFAGINQFSDMTIGDDGSGNALIDFGGGDTLTFTGVNFQTLDASDFAII